MWVRTQDKSTLINIAKFSAIKVFAGEHKGLVYGHFAGASLFHPNSMIIAKYSTYDEALKEVNNIENAINDNPTKVYQIK